MRIAALFLTLLLGCQDGTRANLDVIDLNTATVKQLEALPGIGPKRARSIMASRNARGGHFDSVEQLLAIDGIGPDTLETIRPYVVVSP